SVSGVVRPDSSTRDPRLEVEDHVPKAVDLAPLDDFQRFEAVEGVIRRVEPLGDLLGVHHLGKPGLEPFGLPNPPEARLIGPPPAFPICDRSLGVTGEPREHLAGEAKFPTDLKYRARAPLRGLFPRSALRGRRFLCSLGRHCRYLLPPIIGRHAERSK